MNGFFNENPLVILGHYVLFVVSFIIDVSYQLLDIKDIRLIDPNLT